jgi:hypothetical protein
MPNSTRYGSVIDELLREPRLQPLGPGTPNKALQDRLRLTVVAAFPHAKVLNQEMGSLCLAGLWLYHDFLDEAHEIVQAIETSSGSYWHAIMHRREPDYSNSKYWFRRVGDHPIYNSVYQAGRQLAAQNSDRVAEFLTKQSSWDPMAFVDLCQSATQIGSTVEMLCRQVQQREWELLFDYCYQQAIS